MNVPFSWEAKPGVPKPQSQPSPSASLFETSMLKLPSPPCRSESARLSGDYSGLITYSPPRCRAESARMAKDFLWLEAYSDGSASSFGFGCCKSDDSKKTDPFVEAYKKCTNSRSMSGRGITGGSATNGVKRPNIIRRVLFSLSRKCCASSLFFI
ncbi:hypothetical protein E5676_scaffold134G002440 [Cucumis melo var. makuwa]|nr:hypothetical protein E6C27_scaffold255G001840 [Cucumis melo var. makuwa]TYK20119.1 hypothetical protein E5676_scaffold134G002440 [Cucumis melo var. makuwa]